MAFVPCIKVQFLWLIVQLVFQLFVANVHLYQILVLQIFFSILNILTCNVWCLHFLNCTRNYDIQRATCIFSFLCITVTWWSLFLIHNFKDSYFWWLKNMNCCFFNATYVFSLTVCIQWCCAIYLRQTIAQQNHDSSSSCLILGNNSQNVVLYQHWCKTWLWIIIE